MSAQTLGELQLCIAGVSEALGARLDALDARLDCIEADMAIIKEHLGNL